MFNKKLPPELITRIYEYDPTYKDHLQQQVMPQLLRLFATITRIITLFLMPPVSDRKFAREIKKIVRNSKKPDLKSIYIWFGGRLPKHSTKNKLVLRIYVLLYNHYLTDDDDEEEAHLS